MRRIYPPSSFHNILPVIPVFVREYKKRKKLGYFLFLSQGPCQWFKTDPKEIRDRGIQKMT
jgi:hypothetical protein